jgi:hypothetical protein
MLKVLCLKNLSYTTWLGTTAEMHVKEQHVNMKRKQWSQSLLDTIYFLMVTEQLCTLYNFKNCWFQIDSLPHCYASHYCQWMKKNESKPMLILAYAAPSLHNQIGSLLPAGQPHGMTGIHSHSSNMSHLSRTPDSPCNAAWMQRQDQSCSLICCYDPINTLYVCLQIPILCFIEVLKSSVFSKLWRVISDVMWPFRWKQCKDSSKPSLHHFHIWGYLYLWGYFY